MTGIAIERLRKIVIEELDADRSIREQVDHEGVRTVVNAASKLFKAIESFKSDANNSMTSSVTPGLDDVFRTLEDMLNSPASYVDKPAPMPQRVTLKPVTPGIRVPRVEAKSAVSAGAKRLSEATGDGKLERVTLDNF